MVKFSRHRDDFPEFWLRYEKSLRAKWPENIAAVRFVVLDTETTGFDYSNDRILSMGALTLINDSIPLDETLDIYLTQETYRTETAKIHGILKSEKREQVPESEGMERFLAYLGNAVIVAHHAQFDLKMINAALHRMGLPRLGNQHLDTSILYKKSLLRSNLIEPRDHYSLDDLADRFDIEKTDRHTALGDAYITALAFLAILGRLREKRNLTLSGLLKMR